MKMIVEKQMECRLAGETEVLGENLPQRHFCPSQNPTLPDPGLNPGRRGGKPLWFSGQSYWLQIQRPRVRFLPLPDILRSKGSGTGSTQPREDN
jgi:hypothetical protein